ncbi:MAG: S-adenosyl-l-methionine hydroxide adenosyltransferase family protein [Gemmataceae bacterium]
MISPLITLTTDFGTDSPYVAALKGVVLGIQPRARVLDLSHAIPPQDVRHAAFFLAESVPYFPPGTLHVVVVDPGVGSSRHILYVENQGQRLLVPDNGCWTWLIDADQPPTVRRLIETAYWRSNVSATFHGRDIFAPVAGWLSRGLDPQALGPLTTEWVSLPKPALEPTVNGWRGEVVFIDHFGNLITNIPGAALATAQTILMDNREVANRVRTYADAAPGTLVALVSSGGWLEIAVVQGNAAQRLQVIAGARVLVTGSQAS